MKWFKDLGKAALDASKAKLDDTKDRLAEPVLTDAERELHGRFLALGPAYLSGSGEAGLPPCPPTESKMNRREIRAVLEHPAFNHALVAGEAAAEKGRQEKAAREAADAAEEAARARVQLKLQLDKVDAFYANELNAVVVRLTEVRGAIGDRGYTAVKTRLKELVGFESPLANATSVQGAVFGAIAGSGAHAVVNSKISSAFDTAIMSRTLRDFPKGQRGILRLADVLSVLKIMDSNGVVGVRTALVWNEGKTNLQGLDTWWEKGNGTKDFKAALGEVMGTHFGSAESAAEVVTQKCRQILDARYGVSSEVKAVLMRNLFSGTTWLRPEKAGALAPKGASGTALRLGAFPEGGGDLLYDRNESLVTLAPPGSGKSQAHVLRNLLQVTGPAVVLDVKGEMFAGSAAWRAANVGPVYRFAPDDRTNSLRFNPLEFVSTDPEEAYEEAERIAGLLTVPPDRKGKRDYFEDRAITVIQAVVLFVALTKTGPERSLETVIDLLAGGTQARPADAGEDWDPFDDFIADLVMHDEPSLRRMGQSLKRMPSKQREGVFDTAREQLKVWNSPAIKRLTAETTFWPERLRAENATLYLCVPLEDVRRLASVLRVLLGQTVAVYCKGKAEADAAPITYFLDEMPRLGRMDVVEQALDVGRGFGVRLWMFAQNMGQLETAYPNAKGMVGNCLAKCYMNPEPDTADWLSKHLGEREGLLDGAKHPLVESYELTGEGYRDKVVVMLNGFDNATLDKVPAYADPVCIQRSAAVPAVAE